VLQFAYKISGALKGDFRRFRSSQQHTNGCIWLALSDFLLVFRGDVRSRWKLCRVI